MSLTIVTVTKGEPFARPFLLSMSALAHAAKADFTIGADGPEAVEALSKMTWTTDPLVIQVQSKGYIESVLEDVLYHCRTDYILRLDDDERCSVAMNLWLMSREYMAHPHWKFPRAHLWGDDKTMLTHPQLWPDHQTRLSISSMAGGRRWIHCGSPHGGGQEAPVILEHHKFLVKSLEERRAIVQRYDRIAHGAGSGMAIFSVPEDVVPVSQMTLAPLHNGFLEVVK